MTDQRSGKVIVGSLQAAAMITFLLLSLLLIDVMESQTVVTLEGNRTFNLLNETAEPTNVSWTRDERNQMEGKLMSNQTSDIITEEDERFQDQGSRSLSRKCMQEELVFFSHIYCGDPFHADMLSIGTENWCLLQNVIRPYHILTHCLEKLSEIFGCFYPNSDTQEFFLDVHSLYFHNCSREEFPVEDAPDSVVATLTLIPISIIPLLVYLLVRSSAKASSNTDHS